MTPAERKRQQRARDKKLGLVRFERSVEPELVPLIDKYIERLRKKRS